MAQQRPTPRLNPFIFPTNTDLQFVLLIALLVVVSAAAYFWIITYLPGFYRETYFGILQSCYEKHPIALAAMAQSMRDSMSKMARGEFESAHSTLAAGAAVLRAYDDCTYPARIGLLLRVLAGLGVLFGGGALLYGLMPLWIDRRNRAQPLTRDDAPDLLDALNAMAREMGVRTPRWVWTPLDMRSAAQAYGGWGGKTVWLSGGLVAQHFSAAERFRAVALHELAHIKNGDVGKTYFTTMLFAAYLAFSLLPQVLTLVFFTSGRSAGAWLADLWHALALGVVVLAIRNAILRERESYADVRASAIPGTGAGLIDMLADEARDDGTARWRALATHPPARLRQDTLASTARLFNPSGVAMLTLGLLFGLFSQSFPLLLMVMPNSSSGPTLYFVPLFATLAIGAIALSHWRAQFAHRFGGGPAPVMRGPLLRFALGYLLAQVVLTPASLFKSANTLLDVAGTALGHVAWAGWLVVVLAVTSAWAMALAQIWLTGDDAKPPSRLRFVLWFLAAWGVTALFTLPVMTVFANAVLQPVGGLFFALLMPIHALNSNAYAYGWLLVWALPLLAFLARGRLTQAPAWAFLDASKLPAVASANQSVTQPALQLRLVLTTGLTVGALAMVLSTIGLLFRATVHDSHVGGTPNLLATGLYFAGPILFMIVAAAITANRVRYFRILQGLAAAYIVSISVGALIFTKGVIWPVAEISSLDVALKTTQLWVQYGSAAAVAFCWLIERWRRASYPAHGVQHSQPASPDVTSSALRNSGKPMHE